MAVTYLRFTNAHDRDRLGSLGGTEVKFLTGDKCARLLFSGAEQSTGGR
jgi:hypothetical protein